MGLETKSFSSLWKDKALVEINLAVLYSFQVCLPFPRLSWVLHIPPRNYFLYLKFTEYVNIVS